MQASYWLIKRPLVSVEQRDKDHLPPYHGLNTSMLPTEGKRGRRKKKKNDARQDSLSKNAGLLLADSSSR